MFSNVTILVTCVVILSDLKRIVDNCILNKLFCKYRYVNFWYTLQMSRGSVGLSNRHWSWCYFIHWCWYEENTSLLFNIESQYQLYNLVKCILMFKNVYTLGVKINTFCFDIHCKMAHVKCTCMWETTSNFIKHWSVF